MERSHYQIVWLLSQGQRSEDVSATTGYSRSWIYELVRGYNRLGPSCLGDKRHENPGATPLLNEVQQAQLWQALQAQPADGDLWNGLKVAQWMSDLLGTRVHPQQGTLKGTQKGNRQRTNCRNHFSNLYGYTLY